MSTDKQAVEKWFMRVAGVILAVVALFAALDSGFGWKHDQDDDLEALPAIAETVKELTETVEKVSESVVEVNEKVTDNTIGVQDIEDYNTKRHYRIEPIIQEYEKK